MSFLNLWKMGKFELWIGPTKIAGLFGFRSTLLTKKKKISIFSYVFRFLFHSLKISNLCLPSILTILVFFFFFSLSLVRVNLPRPILRLIFISLILCSHFETVNMPTFDLPLLRFHLLNCGSIVVLNRQH